jgi:hypothetical protein
MQFAVITFMAACFRRFLFFLIFCASPNAFCGDNFCIRLIQKLPPLQLYYLRKLSEIFLLSPENILPKGVVIKLDDPVREPHEYLIRNYSRKQEKIELEIYDENGIGRINAGGIGTRDQIPATVKRSMIVKILNGLNFQYPSERHKIPLTLEWTHTHPPAFGRQFFSFSDIKTAFWSHAWMESLGFENFTVKESIIYPDRKGKFKKKTLIIPARTLSWKRGDYSLGRKTDRAIREFYDWEAQLGDREK